MSVIEEPVVTLTAFGEGRRLSRLARTPMTVEDVLKQHGVQAKGRRVAVNGHSVGLDRVVQDRDQVSVVPRVQGG